MHNYENSFFYNLILDYIPNLCIRYMCYTVICIPSFFFLNLHKISVFEGLTSYMGNEEGWRVERWFNAWECLLLLQSTWVWFLASVHWLLLTHTPWLQCPLLALEGNCTHMIRVHTHTYTPEDTKMSEPIIGIFNLFYS